MFFNPNTCGKWLLNCRGGRYVPKVDARRVFP